MVLGVAMYHLRNYNKSYYNYNHCFRHYFASKNPSSQ
jgi:hypothetical protein